LTNISISTINSLENNVTIAIGIDKIANSTAKTVTKATKATAKATKSKTEKESDDSATSAT
jgi:uncharacterized protein YlxP (DUF503 family)